MAEKRDSRRLLAIIPAARVRFRTNRSPAPDAAVTIGGTIGTIIVCPIPDRL